MLERSKNRSVRGVSPCQNTRSGSSGGSVGPWWNDLQNLADMLSLSHLRYRFAVSRTTRSAVPGATPGLLLRMRPHVPEAVPRELLPVCCAESYSRSVSPIATPCAECRARCDIHRELLSVSVPRIAPGLLLPHVCCATVHLLSRCAVPCSYATFSGIPCQVCRTHPGLPHRSALPVCCADCYCRSCLQNNMLRGCRQNI